MAPIIVSVVVSLGLLAMFRWLAKSRLGAGGVCLLAAWLMFAFVASPFYFLALQSLATLVLTLACLPFRARARLAAWAPVAAVALSYGLLAWISLPDHHRHDRLREKYPLQSISGRLAYEPAAPKLDRARPDLAAVHLAAKTEQRLVEAERRRSDSRGGGSRRTMLQDLHTGTEHEFGLAPGFGDIRVTHIHISEKRLELPPAAPVPQPTRPATDGYEDSGRDLAANAVPADAANATPTVMELQSMHDAGQADFLDAERFGFVKDRGHVAGFQPHQFGQVPALGRGNGPPPELWSVARLELISLLKHKTPVAYVSQNLPRMDELSAARTRHLDEFERQALEQLRSDEDVVVEETPDRIRMVGSLRAASNCLDCHSVRRGELLGALTYELAPSSRIRHRQSSGIDPGA